MKYEIDGKIYNVVVIKKSNKNTYIRVKEDLNIYVTTNYLVNKSYINNLLDNNKNEIKKMIDKVNKKNEKNELFYYLGKVYDIIIVSTLDIEFDESRIYVKSNDYLNKWLKKQTKKIFEERLNIIYNKFTENIPLPDLKLRKMTTRWGVCSKKNTITLNSELIKYDVSCIDYVIVHELSHLVYFDHSKNFWNVVGKYCPNYKEIRKVLKE